MNSFREDIERFEAWLNHTGMSETEFGQKAANNPEALNQLRAGTAPPATALKLNSYVKQHPTGNSAIDGWR